MAMRRADLEALGGFESVKDVLAEDFVLGRAVAERLLGKRVVLGRSIVKCVSVRRALTGFTHRYARWNVMQHQCAGLLAYVGLLLENPTLLATVAAASRPGATDARVVARLRRPAAWRRTRWRAGCCAGRAFRPVCCCVGGVKDLLCRARPGSTASSAARSNGGRTARVCAAIAAREGGTLAGSASEPGRQRPV